jgi:hypothetical protein
MQNNIKITIKPLHVLTLLGHSQANIHLLKLLHCISSSVKIFQCYCIFIVIYLLENIALFLFFLRRPCFFVLFYLALWISVWCFYHCYFYVPHWCVHSYLVTPVACMSLYCYLFYLLHTSEKMQILFELPSFTVCKTLSIILDILKMHIS